MSITANYPNLRPSLLLDFANSQQLDERITFSRSTPALYYDGHTSVLAEQNLLANSNNFIAGKYNLNNVTTTQNIADPFGNANTAWTVQASATNAVHSVNNNLGSISTINGYVTFSCYLQAGTSNYAVLSNTITSSPAGQIVLYAFTLTGSGSATIYQSGNYLINPSAIITQVGSSTWYRCSISYQVPFGTNAGISMDIQVYNSNVITGVGAYGQITWNALGTETIGIFGAQIENRQSPTAYNPTTTAGVNNFIPQLLTAPINTPRFDFNPTTGESLGLLIEQQSTNTLNYSEDFTNAIWQKNGTGITASANIAPNGQQVATKLFNTGAAGTIKYLQQGTIGNNTSSCYAKAGEWNYLTIGKTNNGGYITNVNFNLATGTSSYYQVSISEAPSSYSMTPVGNGWYRCVVTWGTAVSGVNSFFAVSPDGDPTFGSSRTNAGDGYSGIYIWGSQLESVLFPTSYIATTSAQVTRAADNSLMSGTNFSSWYNQAQGTWCVNATSIWNNSVPSIIPSTAWLWVGPAQVNFTAFIYTNTATNAIYTYDGVSASGINNPPFGSKMQVSTSYGNLGKNLLVNGGSASNSAYFNGYGIGNVLYIGMNNAGTQQINGRIAKIAFYSQQLTVAQQQALTGS